MRCGQGCGREAVRCSRYLLLEVQVGDNGVRLVLDLQHNMLLEAIAVWEQGSRAVCVVVAERERVEPCCE